MPNVSYKIDHTDVLLSSRMIGKKQNGVPHAYERQSRALRLAQLALLAALVIGIVASIKVSPDDSQDTLNTIIQMR